MEHINELIDKNLDLLYKQSRNVIHSSDFIDMTNKKLIQKARAEPFAQEMELRGLIKCKDNSCTITEFGFDIVKNGGWLKHLKTQNDIQQKKEIEDKIISDLNKQKLKYDLKLAKWQVKSFWYIFFFGLLGGIYSIVEITKNINEDNSQKAITKEDLNMELKKMNENLTKRLIQNKTLKENK